METLAQIGGSMALKLEDKKLVVEEVSAIVAKSVSMVAAEYRGLTVEQMTNLRAKARDNNVVIRVVKNTLARKAIAGTPFEDMASDRKSTRLNSSHPYVKFTSRMPSSA